MNPQGKNCLIAFLSTPACELGWVPPLVIAGNSTVALEFVLGRGLTSVVYQGELNKEKVAIKYYDTKFASFYHNELSTLQKLGQSTYIPTVLSRDDSGPYFVMSPVGKALETITSDLVIQLLHVLETAHKRGIVHRDIRPCNLLEVNENILLIDWGFATTIGVKGPYSGTISFASNRVLQAKNLHDDFESIPADDLHSLVRSVKALTDTTILRQLTKIAKGDRAAYAKQWLEWENTDAVWQKMSTACDAGEYKQIQTLLAETI